LATPLVTKLPVATVLIAALFPFSILTGLVSQLYNRSFPSSTAPGVRPRELGQFFSLISVLQVPAR
ncbi:MAG: hypothetical protein ACO35Q_09950, partial [Prochlorothrix sp.]